MAGIEEVEGFAECSKLARVPGLLSAVGLDALERTSAYFARKLWPQETGMLLAYLTVRN
jgi:hypothetical protein